MLNSLELRERLVRNTFLLSMSRDRRIAIQLLRRQFHHSPAAVRHQDEILAVFLVHNHVERPIAISQLGNRFPLHLVARLQLGNRYGYERRAGICGENVGLARDSVWDKRPYRSVRFKAAMRPMVDLDPCSLFRFVERIRNRAQAGRELLVGQTGYDHLAVNKSEIGDRFDSLALSAAILGVSGGSIRKAHPSMLYVPERNLTQLAGEIGFQNNGGCFRSASAGYRQVYVMRDGIHCNIADLDLVGRCTE